MRLPPLLRRSRPCGLLLAFALLGLFGCSGSGPRPLCIAAGSRIDTPNGTVAIEALRCGDAVVSVDPRSGERVPARVVLVRAARRPCLELTTACGRTIRATADHPFLSPETGAYEQAAQWLDGALKELCSSGADGRLVAETVVRARRVPGRLPVFDIGVDSAHHNFVAEGLVVHNKTEVRELKVAGSWTGTLTDTDSGKSFPIGLELTLPAAGRVTGSVRVLDEDCARTGTVDASNAGSLRGELRLEDDTVLSFFVEARVRPENRLEGFYRVARGTPCVGAAGVLTLHRDVAPLASRGDDRFWVIRVDEDGAAAIGIAVLGR